MKKLFLLILVVCISTISMAQVRAEVVIGDHQPPHRHYEQPRHYQQRRHYEPRRYYYRNHQKHYYRPGARIIIRGRS